MDEPILLEGDEIINENGSYTMSMDHYHSQCCVGPSFSSTGLRTIFHESPAEFWAFSDLNDDCYEREGTEAFTFGRAAHALILGDEVFEDKFAVIPSHAPPQPIASQVSARSQGRISDAAAERFAFWDPFHIDNWGKEYLTEAELIHIQHIAENLKNDALMPILMEGSVEQSLIWKDEKTGLWLKSRLDILSATGDLADLKSTIQKQPSLLLRDIRMRGYDMQLGLGTMGLEVVKDIPFDTETYGGRAAVLIFVYKRPPYHVIPIEVDFDALHWARLKVRRAIDLAAECIMNDKWPGPIDGIGVYTADYELTRLHEMQQNGELPTEA